MPLPFVFFQLLAGCGCEETATTTVQTRYSHDIRKLCSDSVQGQQKSICKRSAFEALVGVCWGLASHVLSGAVAPQLLWPLLDGLVWRSRQALGGKRRVNYYAAGLTEYGRVSVVSNWRSCQGCHICHDTARFMILNSCASSRSAEIGHFVKWYFLPSAQGEELGAGPVLIQECWTMLETCHVRRKHCVRKHLLALSVLCTIDAIMLFGHAGSYPGSCVISRTTLVICKGNKRSFATDELSMVHAVYKRRDFGAGPQWQLQHDPGVAR